MHHDTDRLTRGKNAAQERDARAVALLEHSARLLEIGRHLAAIESDRVTYFSDEVRAAIDITDAIHGLFVLIDEMIELLGDAERGLIAQGAGR